MQKDIIAELNRENARRALKPFWMIPLVGILGMVGIAIVIVFADWIDLMANAHPIFVGWLLVIGSSCGLWWMFKKRLW